MVNASRAAKDSISTPVYRVLVADLPRGEIAALPAAQAVIWRAIDTLRAIGEGAGQIAVLEHVSRELHALRHERRDSAHAARARLRTLTREWLEHAPLLG